ncbi:MULTISPECIES: helix-turn-helix domain-containing protein [Enterococcus]|uniref:helix-turn-helix domain-containing protein n=1 Tax=Enterococcus TaxID=1350 RepID=UPI000352BF92|nr:MULTISPECIES: helix-turn-helix domain-containing protein [Enterococcus]EPI25480.1 DNA-binding helix-turn-helix protein [Enterococcus faecium LA4B-2]MBO1102359.1 helix-turn-helix transcriptional regulator [Enterococcus hirae]PQD39752.1 XRE family transcriptional regulator [Enterococcus durans]TKN14823.1 XRE family transcriptional regulator [Enterococcus sp. VV15]
MNRLRQLREEKGYSLRELGLKVGMSASVLGNYEREDRQPKLDVWEKLADFFDVSTSYIMGISDERNEVNELLKRKISNMIEQKINSTDEENEVLFFLNFLIDDITNFVNALIYEKDSEFQVRIIDNMSSIVKLMSSMVAETDKKKITEITRNIYFINDLYTGNLFYSYTIDNGRELLSPVEANEIFLNKTTAINQNINKEFFDWFAKYYD